MIQEEGMAMAWLLKIQIQFPAIIKKMQSLCLLKFGSKSCKIAKSYTLEKLVFLVTKLRHRQDIKEEIRCQVTDTNGWCSVLCNGSHLQNDMD
jgi:hypothetical protein